MKANSQPCPTCNGTDRFTLFHNLGLQQSLYDFRVYCTHKSKGCEWTGELRELDNHLNSVPPADKALQGCLYTLINCPLGCTGCVGGLISHKDVKSHVSDNMFSHIMRQNAQIVSFEQELQDSEEHVSQLKGRFEEMNKDKLVLGQQVIELRAKVVTLDVKCRELENEVEELKMKPPDLQIVQSVGATSKQPDTYVTGTYKPLGATFTMTNFEEYKRDNDSWFSPHFYTHPRGYKMCLGVFANGLDKGKGTHVSVFVHMMRGEFDDDLRWPFRGKVTINMVNQEEDKNHVTWIVKLDDSGPAVVTERVVGELARNMKGGGLCLFLRHTNLRPKYLKNHCIKLCIKKVELY